MAWLGSARGQRGDGAPAKSKMLVVAGRVNLIVQALHRKEAGPAHSVSYSIDTLSMMRDAKDLPVELFDAI